MWSFTTRDGVLLPYVSEASFQIPAQDLPPVYIVNGSLYLISPHNLRTNKSLIGKENYPIISNSKLEAIDIDTFEDFTLAEWYLERKRTDAIDLGHI
jgi:CMP-N-acetylneuraminic acid synthetase